MKISRQLMEVNAMSDLYGCELTSGKDIKEDDEAFRRRERSRAIQLASEKHLQDGNRQVIRC